MFFFFPHILPFHTGEHSDLLPVFALISVASIVFGTLRFYSQNNDTISVKEKILLSIFALSNLTVRMGSILFYFAPSLGIFNLLGHWSKGKQEMTKDACEGGNIVREFLPFQNKRYDWNNQRPEYILASCVGEI